jgi:hypothetical protein
MPSPLAAKTLRKLPAAPTPWEVVLASAPIVIEGVELDGLLLVVEPSTGAVRGAGPVARGGALSPVLLQAMQGPMPPARPARPRALSCADEALARRLQAELKGTDIEVRLVERVPAAEAAAHALIEHLAPSRAPGLTVELPLWRSALTLLCQIAPWRVLPDSALFRFGREVPELADAVLLVLGLAGEQEGVVLYPSRGDYERFQRMALSGEMDIPEDITAWQLYLEPEGELEPDERAAVRAAGLSLPGGRMPVALALREGEGWPLTEREQQVLLAAIEAACRLCVEGLERLLDGPREAVARTVLGPVTVRSQPPELLPETWVSSFEHAALIRFAQNRHEDRPSETVPGVVIKARKREAQKLARELSPIDGVSFEPGPEGALGLRVWEGPQDQGILCWLPVLPEVAALLASSPTLLLAVAGGGVTRELQQKDILRELRLSVRSGATRAARHDPVFDGPPETWPKISEVLQRLLYSVLGPDYESLPKKRLRAEVELASAVWNAVVYADFGGKPEVLEGLRDSVIDEPEQAVKVEVLVLEKRQQFPGDPRITGGVEVTVRKDGAWIMAKWAVVPGYRVGGQPAGG